MKNQKHINRKQKHIQPGKTNHPPTTWLSVRVEDTHVHRRKQVTNNRGPAFARALVAHVDVSHLPVGPVQEVAENGDGVRMLERIADDRLSVAAVQLTTVNVLEFSVGPVDAAGSVVDGKTVRPGDLRGYERLARLRGAVHSGALDLGGFAPVGPVDVAGKGRTLGDHEEKTFNVTELRHNVINESVKFSSLYRGTLYRIPSYTSYTHQMVQYIAVHYNHVITKSFIPKFNSISINISLVTTIAFNSVM